MFFLPESSSCNQLLRMPLFHPMIFWKNQTYALSSCIPQCYLCLQHIPSMQMEDCFHCLTGKGTQEFSGQKICTCLEHFHWWVFLLSMFFSLLNTLFISPFVNLSTFRKLLISKTVLFLILVALCLLRSICLFPSLIPSINLMSCAYIFTSLFLILKISSSLTNVCKIWYVVRSFFLHRCLSILPSKIFSISVQNGVLMSSFFSLSVMFALSNSLTIAKKFDLNCGSFPSQHPQFTAVNQGECSNKSKGRTSKAS